ncbi:MAG: trypsin-like peptidase domain-containing protein [Lactobacillaceae bacterium]|jgi:serine protease Do|nr:trypsin-like peptidase domain-containing protein [Lactobacillaceae bacterium]
MSNKDSNTNYFLVSILSAVVGAVLVMLVFYFLVLNPSTSVSDKSNVGATTSVVKLTNVPTTDAEKAYTKMKGAVVTVENYQSQSSQIPSWFEQWMEQNGQTVQGSSQDSELQLTSEGSGVVFKKDSQYAYIVTNNHVVDGASKLTILTSNGKTATAKLMGTDKTKDLAVIRVKKDVVSTVASFADSSKVSVGQPVLALGSPLGSAYASTLTAGIISATNREVSEGDISLKALQTDAAINPGNSGGALINYDGQVVGINSMKVSTSTDGTSSVEGMGFAIPSDTVQKVIAEILGE